MADYVFVVRRRIKEDTHYLVRARTQEEAQQRFDQGQYELLEKTETASNSYLEEIIQVPALRAARPRKARA